MPVTEALTIKDIPATKHRKLKDLIHERAVLGYGFSFKKLYRLITKFVPETDEALVLIHNCISAVDDKEQKAVQSELNDGISAIYTEHGVKSLRDSDPFGRTLDIGILENSGIPRIDKNRMLEVAPTLGISTSKIIELIEKSTVKTPFVTVSVRGVKERE